MEKYLKERIRYMKKNNSNENAWLYWGTWNPNILTVSLWQEAMTSAVPKKMGLLLSGDLQCLHGRYYFLKKDFKRLENILEKEGVSWLEKLAQHCGAEIKALAQPAPSFVDFLNRLPNFLGGLMLVTFCDPWLEQKIKEVCAKQALEIDSVLQRIQPKKKTLLLQYTAELEVLKKKDIDAFVEKWRWVGTHAFGGTLLTRQKVLRSLRLIQHHKRNEPLAQQKIKDAELLRLINIGERLVFLRSSMVEEMNRAIFMQRAEMKKFAKRKKLRFAEISSLTHVEIKSLYDNKKIKRKINTGNFNYIVEKGKTKISFVKKLNNKIQRLGTIKNINFISAKGTIACRGYARGRARIVASVADCKRVRLGDILIAPETTPDFIAAMQRAAAFVTDQGGITSHAAIIAREMNKPCIVGTKRGTSIFHDGEMIEVDAHKGRIKKA